MKRFVRWLRYVGLWVRRMPVAPYYWWAVAVVVVSVVTTWLCGWSERAFRLTGMLLQLGGVLTVVWGILKTRADFGQPTVRSQFQRWIKEFPSYHPRVIEASMNGMFPSMVGEAYGYSTHGPSADQTVEGRLKHLEKIIKELEEAQGKTHIAVLQAEKKAQKALDVQARQFAGLLADVSKKIETTATGGVHISAVGVVLLFVGTIFGGAAPELSGLQIPFPMTPLWKGLLVPVDVNKYLTDFLAPASAALAALVAYVAVYKNSQPQIVAYYQPSERQQSIIELVIENVGTGNATDIKFSKPIPIGWYGIEAPSGHGSYIPTSGIPLLAPGQRLVFHGGQFGGLAKELGAGGLPLDITYKFNPPMWRKKTVVDTCVLSIEHFRGMATMKSMEQAVVDAIEGRNSTTIKDIRGSLQKIEQHLAAISKAKQLPTVQDEPNERVNEPSTWSVLRWIRNMLIR
ncbi:hypothetical protein [Alicycliphilus denitrificans]|uniref:Uncharacterized protein n=1 Tax=Alicycliphilus denitrificans (strain DSM 14773 / CIP 107495 / K601) TaxID=596154 RepID=F4GFM8_ALIDK|nr:hypothetical protein [Alicycliphilus denitrificans]AEB85043.1 hypothetical protein Alide2_2687 [Alicycliphilus denitrificans K601]